MVDCINFKAYLYTYYSLYSIVVKIGLLYSSNNLKQYSYISLNE